MLINGQEYADEFCLGVLCGFAVKISWWYGRFIYRQGAKNAKGEEEDSIG